jgi:hypothetical protein
MAYPGTKASRTEELEHIAERSWTWAVDAFYGSGGLTQAFLDRHQVKFPIAGEIFLPLRYLYHAKVDLEALCYLALTHISEVGEIEFWETVRASLRSESLKYTNYEAFVILNNLSHGNGMRHGKRKDGTIAHNLKLADEKLRSLRTRGTFINPIALTPKTVYANWRSALMAASGRESIALLDPPYLNAGAIYPDENPLLCACPPVQLAMERGYGAIVAYNSNDLNLDFMLNRLASQHGYSIEMKVTEWNTKHSAKSQKKQSTEAMWIFHRGDF